MRNKHMVAVGICFLTLIVAVWWIVKPDQGVVAIGPELESKLTEKSVMDPAGAALPVERNQNMAKQIIGTWESEVLKSEWGPMQMQYTFGANGVLLLTMSDGQGNSVDSQSFLHRYNLISDELSFVPSGSIPNQTIRIDGNTMMMESSGQTTDLKRASSDESIAEFIANMNADLKSDDSEIRSRAVHALRYAGPAARISVANLIALLDEEESSVGKIALEALGNIGPQEDEIVPSMISVLKGEDALMATFAARELARFGSDAKAAVPALRHCASSSDATLAHAAADALKSITDE